MIETGNEIPPQILRRRRTTAAIVVGVTLLVGASPFLLFATYFTIGLVQAHFRRSRLLTDVDHLAVRDAGRLLLVRHERDSWIESQELPEEIAQLGPSVAYIDDRGFLRLEFGGGFYHFGLFVVPEDAEGITLDVEPPLKYKPLEDGIWFYEET